MSSLYSIDTQSLEGEATSLSAFDGRVTLVVNVASECGYTPQYTGLQALHTELSDQGFSVLGCPSNEFGAQEPGDGSQIRDFCDTRYGVTFPMLAKLVTQPGDDQSPIYALLTADHDAPNWNFCKYLVGKDGRVLGFYPSAIAPDDAGLRAAIIEALAA